MSKNIVADFSAFLSVSVDDDSLFETREGRVVMTRDKLVVAGEDAKRPLPLDALDSGHAAPIVCVADEEPADPDVVSEPGVVDVITLSSRTEHYEDVADAVEQAVLAARLEADPVER